LTSLDDAVIARLKKGGHTFELFVDPDAAMKYRAGEVTDAGDVVAAEHVFKDAGAADKASETLISEVFGTADFTAVAAVILEKGDIHLTTEQKKRITEERRRQVVEIIARNAMNPQTKTPHPPARIEKALEEGRFQVSIQKNAQSQVDAAMKVIRPIIPIKFDTVEMAVKLSAEDAKRIYQTLHELGEVKKEEWVGSHQICLLEIPAGIQDDVSSKLNKLTHGAVEIKILK